MPKSSEILCFFKLFCVLYFSPVSVLNGNRKIGEEVSINRRTSDHDENIYKILPESCRDNISISKPRHSGNNKKY